MAVFLLISQLSQLWWCNCPNMAPPQLSKANWDTECTFQTPVHNAPSGSAKIGQLFGSQVLLYQTCVLPPSVYATIVPLWAPIISFFFVYYTQISESLTHFEYLILNFSEILRSPTSLKSCTSPARVLSHSVPWNAHYSAIFHLPSFHFKRQRKDKEPKVSK